MKNSLVFALIFIALCHCEWAKAVSHPVPRVDQVAYLAKLKVKRPDLITNWTYCYNALKLKPEFRTELLESKKRYADIAQEHYTPMLFSTDKFWTRSMQESEERIIKETNAFANRAGASAPPTGKVGDLPSLPPFYASGYNIRDFVGYRVGPAGHNQVDPSGVVFKVFFEFKHFVSDLTPSSYEEFTRLLAKNGFRGDSKVPLNPGAVRFQFNNIIVHAFTKESALIAEKVGLEFFGEKLAGTGRGVDLMKTKSGVKDWHNVLCSGELPNVPEGAMKFINYRDSN